MFCKEVHTVGTILLHIWHYLLLIKISGILPFEILSLQKKDEYLPHAVLALYHQVAIWSTDRKGSWQRTPSKSVGVEYGC
jgi:hypothetical protein